MALRVLLADESTTIKKVMQLALQDFGVEVKTVHTGVDVMEVARSFKPDVIFADVLLQKKNGYEVCAELKRDPQLGKIPLVLMWSSFMDLDEGQAQNSGADRRLEKPFDVENLRSIIIELVPRTRTQRLAHFLQFPEKIADPVREEERQKQSQRAATGSETLPPPPPVFAERETVVGLTPPPPPSRVAERMPATPPPIPLSSLNDEGTKTGWSMESFEDLGEFAAKHEAPPPSPAFDDQDDDDDENFSELRLGTSIATNRPAPPVADSVPGISLKQEEDPWSHQDLSRFKIEIPQSSLDDDDLGLEVSLPVEDVTESLIARGGVVAQTKSGNQGFSVASEANNDLPIPSQEFELDSADEAPEGLQIELTDEDDEPTLKVALDSSIRIADPTAPRTSGSIPQLSADRLEEIIRAQSREIIETVVRRVVPEIASELIREELTRLLEDTAARETRGASRSRSETLR